MKKAENSGNVQQAERPAEELMGDSDQAGNSGNAVRSYRSLFRTVWFPLLVTAAIVCVICAAKIGYLLTAYPQQEISIEELCGEGGSNLQNLSVDGDRFYAETTGPTITLEYNGGVPVRSIGFTIRTLSRENCWSYITVVRSTGSLERSAAIMAEGSNAIDFHNSSPSDQVQEIRFQPVPVRGVSFELTSFTLNPRTHIAMQEVLNFAVLLAVIGIFEAVVLVLLRERRHTGLPHLWTIVLAAVLQSLLGVLFIWQYFTAEWSAYATFYHFAAFLAEGGMMLLLHIPVPRPQMGMEQNSSIAAGRTAGAEGKESGANGTEKAFRRYFPPKFELPLVRTLILAVFSFSVLELLYSDMFRLDDLSSYCLNILVYAVPTLALYAVWGRRKRHWSYGVPLIFWLLIAMVNHYYFEYRAQCIEYSDLSMAGTAKNVMNGGYKLTITPDVLFVYTAFALMLIAINTEACRGLPDKKLWKRLAAGACTAAAVLTIALNLPVVNLWNTNIATLHHGYALSYFSFMEKSLEKPTPAGYSAAKAEEILEPYEEAEDNTTGGTEGSTEESAGGRTAGTEAGTSGKQPNIIVVMDEAFADLPTVYGFDTDVDDLPFIHSLEGNNVRKGWMLSSVFGGTTANTEYEFLTGNSTAFLSAGSVPYTQYINSEQESLAWLLGNRGYSTLAFHPYLASGYKRYKVYPLLGFDDFFSSEDGLLYNDKIRTYISDSSDFKDLESLFEENDDGETPQFIFNVTMQNHGNYNTDTPAVDVTVKPTDEELASLAQLEEYLSLAHETDKAFEELVSYFEKVDEPTIILMFGDHQPGLNESTLETICPEMYEEDATLAEREKKYTVPYICQMHG